MKNRISKHSFVKLLPLLICLILSCTTGFSQQAIFSTTFLSLTDTSYLGDSDTNVRVVVKNISNAPYAGYINFYYTTDLITFTGVQFGTIPFITLNPQQTDTAKCIIKFDSTYFNPGGNIIVVWSSGNAKTAADSLWDQVYINPSTADVHNIDMSSVLSVYPTLTNDLINIQMLSDAFNNKLFPETIKITDMFGRRMSETEITHTGKNKIQLDVARLNSGIYLLEIYLPSNRRVTAKFIRL